MLPCAFGLAERPKLDKVTLLLLANEPAVASQPGELSVPRACCLTGCRALFFPASSQAVLRHGERES